MLDLATLRTDHRAAVRLLRTATNRQPIVVDIVEESVLHLLALALIEAETSGTRLIYRVGPPFVRGRIGQAVPEPVSLDVIRASRGDRDFAAGSLVVIGSHVELTTRQLGVLRERKHLVELEIEVPKVIDERRDDHVAELAASAIDALATGIGRAFSDVLIRMHMPIILAGFLLSLALRASQGSATVAILTAAGLLAQPILDAGYNDLQLTLVTLAICFGGLGLSHIDDCGFWIVTKYLGLTVKDGLRTSTIFRLPGFLLSWGVFALVS